MIIQTSPSMINAPLHSDLPLSAPQEDDQRSSTPTYLNGLSVLIADDDKQVSHFLSTLLKETFEGITVYQAHDGFDAGIKIRECAPDLVLVDLMMPGLSGFELCEGIKSSSDTAHIKVLAMTGYPLEENINQIMAAGAEACLKKPFESKDLFELLKKIAPPKG